MDPAINNPSPVPPNGADNGPLKPDQQEFLRHEFDSLRHEIELRISASELVETLTIGAIAVIYGWCFSQDPGPIRTLALWLPVVLTVLGAFRYGALIQRIMEISAYIRRIEKKVYDHHQLGYENYLQVVRMKKTGRAIALSALVLWSLMFLGTLTFALTQMPTKDDNSVPPSSQPQENVKRCGTTQPSR